MSLFPTNELLIPGAMTELGLLGTGRTPVTVDLTGSISSAVSTAATVDLLIDRSLVREIPASRILIEGFEGPGYEGAWEEIVVDGLGTFDKDYSTSNIGSPSGWGNQCLRLIYAGNMAPIITYSVFGDDYKRFIRHEFYLTAIGLVNDEDYLCLGGGVDASLSLGTYQFGLERISGENYLSVKFVLGLAGEIQTITKVVHPTPISLNTKYRLEIKWDKTNNLAEARINGTIIDSEQSLIAGSVFNGMVFLGSIPSEISYTCCFDNIVVDSVGWVGDWVWDGQSKISASFYDTNTTVLSQIINFPASISAAVSTNEPKILTPIGFTASISAEVGTSATVDLLAVRPLAASVSSECSPSATIDLLTLRPFSGSIASEVLATATPDITIARPFPATISAEIVVTGTADLLAVRPLPASISAELAASATVDLLAIRPLSASISAESSIEASADLTITRSLTATVAAASTVSTPILKKVKKIRNIVLKRRHRFTASISASITSIDTPDLTTVRSLVADVSAAISVSEVDLPVVRPIPASIDAASTTAEVDIQVIRPLVVSVSPAFSIDSADVSVLRGLVGSISTAIEVSATIDILVLRSLIGSISSVFTTGEPDLEVISGAKEFSASINSAISTNDTVALKRTVSLVVSISVAHSTSDTIDLLIGRSLAASISSEHSTSATIDLLIGRSLVASIAAAHTTLATIDLLISRSLVASISSTISTSQPTILRKCSFTGVIDYSFSSSNAAIKSVRPIVASIFSEITTSISSRVFIERLFIGNINPSVLSSDNIDILIIRPLVASISSVVSTSQPVLWTSYIRSLVGSINSAFTTPNAHLVSTGLLQANIAAGVSTSETIDLLVVRPFVATIPAIISTIDAHLWVSFIRSFVGSISSEITTASTADIFSQRPIVGQINSLISTSSGRINTIRPLAASVSSAFTTQEADLWISYIRSFVGEISSGVTTSATTDILISRLLTGSISSSTYTRDVELWTSKILYFISSISSAISTTSFADIFSLRPITGTISSSISTTSFADILSSRFISGSISSEVTTSATTDLLILRNFIGEINSAFTIQDAVLKSFGLLQANIAAGVTTSETIDLLVSRLLIGAISPSVITQNVNLWISYIRNFEGQINSAIVTNDPVLTMTGQILLSALIALQLSTSNINGVVSRNFSGSVGTDLYSSQPDINSLRRITSVIQPSIETSEPGIIRGNNFASGISSGFDVSISDLIIQRRLQALISNYISTDFARINSIRPISAEVSAEIQTNDLVDLWLSGVKAFLAQINSSISTSLSVLNNGASFSALISSGIETGIPKVYVLRNIPVDIFSELISSYPNINILRLLQAEIIAEIIINDIICDIGWLGYVDCPSVCVLERMLWAVVLSREMDVETLRRETSVSRYRREGVEAIVGISLEVLPPNCRAIRRCA
jgi:hypothetical protein